MPPNTVMVSRPSHWGNPYKLGGVDNVTGEKIETRAHAVRLFRERIMDDNPGMQIAAQAHLVGKNLACWCPPDEPCHADVLLVMANAVLSGAATETTTEVP